MRKDIKSENDERQDIVVEVILEQNIIKFTGRYKLKNMQRMIVDVVEIGINADAEMINQTIGDLAISINKKVIKYLNIVDIFNNLGDDITVNILESED